MKNFKNIFDKVPQKRSGDSNLFRSYHVSKDGGLSYWVSRSAQMNDSVYILLIGNNPIEMSSMLDTIARVPGRKIITEIAFDVKSSWDRLIKFHPNFILIDDNIGKMELTQTIEALVHHEKTRNVPITVLKNSNYEEALVSADILDYLLKGNLTAESLYNAIKNTLKFSRTRQYLMDVYTKRKSLLLNFG